MSNLSLLGRLTSIFTGWFTSFERIFSHVFKIFEYGSKIAKFILFIMSVYVADLILSPVLSHLVVIRNTITFFLTNTGMIGPITIQFFYFAISAFVFFIISRSITRLI